MNLSGSRGTAALFAVVLVALVAATPAAAAGPKGVAPVGADGQRVNLDFEAGSLDGWTATGDAFAKQPMKGDTVAPRRKDQKSGHQGEYWVGGFEAVGDDATGTLSSRPFKVDKRWGSFLIGGGAWFETRVELVRADTNRVVFRYSAYDGETLRPVVVDFGKHVGREFFVRLVDERKGHWGHLNFDTFLLYDGRPQLANALPGKPATPPPAPDVVAHAGVKPDEAVAAMTMPDGFRATLFAAEPDVVQPIAFTTDARGRVWVAQCVTYPVRQPEGQGKDSIIILEDTDGDGRHDKRTVFAEKLNLVSGIEVGFGGVWVGAAPYLLFIPDADRDDRPDGPPQVMLDGWAYQDTHEMLNTFAWGPDGWLYGCHGVFTHSNVGRPGASDAERQRINAGIWRFHPTKHVFEVFAEGTSNPWGLDFNDQGQMFIEACVIPHFWHVIQGAHYQRQAGTHFNPYVFDDIKQHGDHVHYAGNQGPHAGNGRSDTAGGGHAHSGAMVYLGGSWPEQYRNQLFLGNIHGQRINMDIPEPKGSGYVGKHGPDFLNFNDRWSQVVNFRYDQDGSVYFIDWYDEEQCHTPNEAAHDRTNGRIYKLAYGDTKMTTTADLAKATDAELLNLQLHKNDWHVRAARRLLQERAAAGKLDETVRLGLISMIDKSPDETRQLRALWALHVTGGVPAEVATSILRSAAAAAKSPYLVAWTIQLLAEDGKPSAEALTEFARLAKESTSPVVRLYLASALKRIPAERRWDVLAGLLGRSEDATDHNLPLMYWYAHEPLAAADPGRALAAARAAKIPNILAFTVRRIAAMEGDAPIAALTGALAGVSDESQQVEILRGINEALRGRRSMKMPPTWAETERVLARSANPAVAAPARALGVVTFGSPARCRC